MRRLQRLWWSVACMLCAGAALAAPMSPEDIPFSLRPWIKWVLADNPQFECPYLYNNHDERRCAWSTPMQVNLDDRGGAFSIDWQVYAPSWVILPGDAQHWPQDVVIDGAPAVVTERGGRPAIWMQAGMAQVQGRFDWAALPESLWVPQDVGIVLLTVNGVEIPFPNINAEGRLWLAQGETGGDGGNDSLSVKVYRLITDDIPLQTSTRIELDVAGRAREVALEGALLADFIPLGLDSALPARLDPDGTLRLQLRPGHWTVSVDARSPRERSELTLAPAIAPWPDNELWSFEARNHLRLVDVQGLAAVDPNQTTLPPEWRSFPAYRIAPGETMQILVNRRGDPQPEPDRLSLDRQLWLDFDGKGYTFSDRIGGTMTAGWRLDLSAPMQLGRVAVDGQPQLVTRAQGSGNSGVEVRRGTLNLNADGRYEGDVRHVPAIGWDHDFQQVNATLHLPPGWRLFSVGGVDDKRSTQAWLQRWSMLDIFLVGIAAVIIFRLWDLGSALLGFATLTLVWFEPGAPRYLWLNLIAAIALLRVLPEGRLRWLIGIYRTLSVLALVAVIIPFLVQQVRVGLFPQLEQPWRGIAVAPETPGGFAPPAASAPTMAPEAGAVAEAPAADMATPAQEAVTGGIDAMKAEGMERRQELEELAGKRKRRIIDYSSGDFSSRNYQEIDPKANVQTGPGLPRWDWTAVPLTWHGTVEKDQQLRLMLISPRQHLLLNLLRVMLVALLAAAFIRASFPGLRRIGGGAAGAAALAMIFIAGTPSRPALAEEYPTPDLLNELRARLTAAPECVPGCAQAPRLRLSVQGNQLQLRLEVHAVEHVAVPLPGAPDHWLPTEVSVDGVATDALARSPAGELWLRVGPGAHQAVLSGPLPLRGSVQLPLPLTPRRVEIEQASGWRIDGVREDGTSDAQLVLTREADNGAAAAMKEAETPTLPTFARVERTLLLGLEWRVHTRIVRLSAPDSAIVLEVPLLAGESITTEQVRVIDGKAQVNLAAQETATAFDSILAKRPEITLKAPATTGWVEVWRADVSPVLHATMTGIPVVHHQNTQGNWLPEWRPWPGESVTLTITRPEGVPGNTLTIDASRLVYTPGERTTDVTMTLDARSSQGGQHAITLPEGAMLQSATINGVAQPIRQQGRLVTLPLTPGAQSFALNWREARGIGNRYRTADVDLGIPSVNASTQIAMPVDRWILLTGGPLLGPAVMFWGLLVVIALVAGALARVPLTPLGVVSWLLLGIGLSQVSVVMGLIVAGWLLALGWRGRWPASLGKSAFNLGQIGLAALTLAALYCLYQAIRRGLLGLPEMQIGGNASSTTQLNWYQDHVMAVLPTASITSVPLIAYHLLMLGWALWLAFALVGWMRWGWRQYSHHGLWREFHLFRRRDLPAKA
ncbi:MAG: hypothetical protein NFCOHLIN_00442 [Gammaproteobacteria bacterium]|nr:hypothetical protein [Gammaproteobacteria bacterium]